MCFLFFFPGGIGVDVGSFAEKRRWKTALEICTDGVNRFKMLLILLCRITLQALSFKWNQVIRSPYILPTVDSIGTIEASQISNSGS
ncbi:hypothetical protein ACN38_g8976 [Penicillium nordicum]|uniref:Uncharacterized protein n=1 Tax=Penicillium nordicum TaxID=229535 RepID=A0A0N0RY59_9EURO|nr:hypothetical protein ACN38_g8976 [Penicillium nordicum]